MSTFRIKNQPVKHRKIHKPNIDTRKNNNQLNEQLSKSYINKQENVNQKEPSKSVKYNYKIINSELNFSSYVLDPELYKELVKTLIAFKVPHIFKNQGMNAPCGILLHGPPGCGKTRLAHVIAGSLSIPMIKMCATEIISGVSGESEEKLRNLFKKASKMSPCIIFIDELDAITQKRENSSRDMEKRIVSQLLDCIDSAQSTSNILVVGATSRLDTIDVSLRRNGRFDFELPLGMPNRRERREILNLLTEKCNIENRTKCLDKVVEITPGFVGADLESMVKIAVTESIYRKISTDYECQLNVNVPENLETCINFDDMMIAAQKIIPSTIREGFSFIPKTLWSEIGGLEDVRREIKSLILDPLSFPERYESLGITISQGCLLAGPPGCGKTLIAKALANELGVNFLSVKGPELLNMYVGESERAVRNLFERANNSAPCVIFFDEIDALCPHRSSGVDSSKVSSRLVTQLLTEMDGVYKRKSVFILAATNRPDIIDPAVIRPGRIDKILYVNLPSYHDKISILNAISHNKTKPKIDENVNFNEICEDERSEGFSGADLYALVRQASLDCLEKNTTLFNNELIVTTENFNTALEKVKRFKNKEFLKLHFNKMIISAGIAYTLCLIIVAILIFFVIFHIITFDELNVDYKNPIDYCKTLNPLVIPEYALHFSIMLILGLSEEYFSVFFNVPIALYHILKYSRRTPLCGYGVYDPTRILLSREMKISQMEGWIKLVFFLMCFFYYMYSMIYCFAFEG
ncbi:Nuclear valosin-containing protein-like protein [Intoshia linei]|uniref:Nuclear valosin-containing protein-like protein n=1 Tax=Intoshia linei TaxID=1819745 RepID=A0A177B2E6_9BILA|nr:Nuclear valosin-containing protein-like protein [Intoshia linei]